MTKARVAFFGIILAMALCAMCVCLSWKSHVENLELTPRQKADQATCLILDEDNQAIGTGILLDTGYILTAAHCVDTNGDGSLSKDEMLQRVIFTGDLDPQQTRVAYFGKADFAFLEWAVASEVAANKSMRIGDEVYTIGATLGGSPMISGGYVSHWHDGWARASCFVSRGNSGGGIFNSNGELIGVVHAMGTAPLWSRFEVPVIGPDGGIGLYRSRALGFQEINQMCVFLTTREILMELDKKSLGRLLVKDKQPTLVDVLGAPWAVGIGRIALLEGIFILAVIILWRKF